MRMRTCITLAAVLAAAASASAMPAAAERQPTRGSPAPARPEHAPDCLEGYWNVGVPNGFYYPAGAGVEVLDDLHIGMYQVDEICAIDFGYYNLGPAATNAMVSFYANNADDTVIGGLLTSLPLPGLVAGENSFHVEVPSATLAEEIWLGVSFSTADAGMLTADPPWPGASDDYFYLRPPGELYTFGGNPRGNFLLSVYATGVRKVGVEEGPLAASAAGFLHEPRPNPARGGVDFGIAVREAGRVQVVILDAAGRVYARLHDEVMEPGDHPLRWDGRGASGRRVPPGVYLVRLSMPRFAGIRKVVLME